MSTKQTTLFNKEAQDNNTYSHTRPLAARMRASCLDELVGQEHLFHEESILLRIIKNNQFGSILLYGPPGSGKTTLAEVIAKETDCHFIKVNAVSSNVAEIREILSIARVRTGTPTLLFIDEIHRFNKSQQDLLLPDIEEGNIQFIGATTHNPSFYINPPLLSRSHLFRLNPLEIEPMIECMGKALIDKEKGLGGYKISAQKHILKDIASLANGDLRRALNTLETIALSKAMGSDITEEDLKTYAGERQMRYDKNEDEHYDTISAFIKSIRGSDPDAALYWLAKMLEGGEDPRFIARRLVISASEDIGLADSRALGIATATFQACEQIGMPECAINLGHATTFLATCPKSNTAYKAIKKAQHLVKTQPIQDVPSFLKDSSKQLSRDLNRYNQEPYYYSHDYPENITGQEYLKTPLDLYVPKESGAESAIAQRIKGWKALKSSIKQP